MKDIWGNPIDKDVLLRDKYIVPPFSIIDTKMGEWQKRKRLWKNRGIKSEIGRASNVYNTKEWVDNLRDNGDIKGNKLPSNTSIFDPVLCEIMYHWFCPDSGHILDPFAGGSVRGIVAHYLGYKYSGIELRQEQVDSNRDQALDILKVNNQPQWYVGDSNEILDNFIENPVLDNTVKISIKSLKQKFHPCEIDYIKNTCHGRCCEGSNGLMITIHDNELVKYSDKVKIENNFIVDEKGTGLCPFKKNHLCSIHKNKPFGCKTSPFTLTKKNTLIIRNRYRSLRCYNRENSVPAYIAHKWSLEQIFGKKETNNIIKKIEGGCEEIYSKIPQSKIKMMLDNDVSKNKNRNKTHEVFDFIFSCPPYGDLEVYSDLKEDISNMPYKKFKIKYTQIIKKSCSLLKPGGFACFVVGEFRDKNGNYVGFVPDTYRAFKKAGLDLYNEIIFSTSIASAPLRANGNMKNKKVVKVHQNILVFKKRERVSE